MESHEAGGSEGADDGAGDELGPGFSDAPAGENTGEPGMFGSHGILDVPVFALRSTPRPSGMYEVRRASSPRNIEPGRAVLSLAQSVRSGTHEKQ